MNKDEPNFVWFISKKIDWICYCYRYYSFGDFFIFQKDFNAIEKQYGGGAPKEEGNAESLTKENKDGTVSNKNQMGLSGGRKSTKELVFIAKLIIIFPTLKCPTHFTLPTIIIQNLIHLRKH